MRLELIKITDLPTECGMTIVPGHIYSVSRDHTVIMDIHTNAIYYTSELHPGNSSVTNTIEYGNHTYSVAMYKGQLRLISRFTWHINAVVDVPRCHARTHDALCFCISRENPLRIYVNLGIWIIELEIVPN